MKSCRAQFLSTNTLALKAGETLWKMGWKSVRTKGSGSLL